MNLSYSLSEFPERFPKVDDDGLSRLGYRNMFLRDRVIIFTVSKEKHIVRIVRMLHGKQDWLRIFLEYLNEQ
ncbi:MAG: type II toxin-antitoxin system RelE/ParE family toxin [Oscillospiraceae bacterium]|jgi:plasmid stabilization system protein ParE|nr:type II toxin-antitoxin system RelE/ParE family toxin [Oscillospiraceae bacterium]